MTLQSTLSINPQLKEQRYRERLAKQKAVRDAARTAVEKQTRTTGRRKGQLTKVERLIVGEVVASAPTKSLSEVQTQALAITLNRNPDTIKEIIISAREKLQANAEHYVDVHRLAADQALAQGDIDVARKAAEWAISKISKRDDDGTVHRIVEVDDATNSNSGPRVMIGIALGGMATKPTT